MNVPMLMYSVNCIIFKLRSKLFVIVKIITRKGWAELELELLVKCLANYKNKSSLNFICRELTTMDLISDAILMQYSLLICFNILYTCTCPYQFPCCYTNF